MAYLTGWPLASVNRAVFKAYSKSSYASEFYELISRCEDTDSLARDLFVAFSEPATSHVPVSKKHGIEFLLSEQAKTKKQIEEIEEIVHSFVPGTDI